MLTCTGTWQAHPQKRFLRITMTGEELMAQSRLSQLDSARYQIVDKIGEGGFAQVYKAKQRKTGRTVAIKFLELNPAFDQQKHDRYITRFNQECQLCNRLDHPNIVKLLAQGIGCNGHLYAVYEYIEGLTLRQHLTRHGPLSATLTAKLMTQILVALSHAHEQGIIHRDIKPANIMLEQAANSIKVKVLDFGIGILIDDALRQDPKSLKQAQETLGTPSYSAPEQLRAQTPTAKTDLYTWGLVFIECLTGQAVISGSTAAAICHQQLSPLNVPLPPAIINHPLATLLRQVLAKKVSERNITIKELQTQLSRLDLSNLDEKFLTNHKPPDTNPLHNEQSTQIHSWSITSPYAITLDLTTQCEQSEQ